MLIRATGDFWYDRIRSGRGGSYCVRKLCLPQFLTVLYLVESSSLEGVAIFLAAGFFVVGVFLTVLLLFGFGEGSFLIGVVSAAGGSLKGNFLASGGSL